MTKSSAASDLAFPLLLLSRTSGASFAETPVDLATFPGALYWKGKFFDGLRIVDATGGAHEVVSSIVQRPKTRFGQWLARLFCARIAVEAETRPIGRMHLADIIRTVEAGLEKESELFEEFSGRDFPSVKLAFARCKSVRDVVKILAGDIDG